VVYVAPGNEEGFRGFYEAFNSALKALGYVEGRDLSIEVIWGAGGTEGLASLAAGVVARKPDLILTASSTYVAAFKKETSTIPIVFATAGNPVEQGFAASLRRPGGNITGVLLHLSLSGKITDVVREALPTARRIAILGHDADPVFKLQLEQFEPAARRLKFETIVVRISREEDLDRAFKELATRKAEVLYVPPLALGTTLRRQLTERCLAARLPMVGLSPNFAELGGLIGYGTRLEENYRRAAALVDKILRGGKPGELPIEQPERVELVVNMKAARAIGATISKTTLARADKVIE
jgi:putative ABC transport system substrate-binding protein